MSRKPLCIDLFCGLGGFSDGFLSEGWNCIGFDVERHDYGTGGYPGQLVLQDVLTLHGRQFRGAACIVASPPCQEFSYMAMPWTRAKQIARALRQYPEGQCICPQKCDCQDFEKGLVSNLCPDHNLTPVAAEECTATLHLNGAPDGDSAFPEGYTGSRAIPQLTVLFDACFRIQREASEAAGHHIPMVVENVKGAQPWVGRANASYGSFYLWGDVRSVGGRIVAARRVEFGAPVVKAYRAMKCGHPERSFRDGDVSMAHLTNRSEHGRKVPMNFHEHEKTGKPGRSFQSVAVDRLDLGVKSTEGWSGFNGGGGGGSGDDLQGLSKVDGSWTVRGAGQYESRSHARKAASAQIAKIPFELSRYIARSFYPDRLEASA